eukprot:3732534-Amphidinium_carterae.2
MTLSASAVLALSSGSRAGEVDRVALGCDSMRVQACCQRCQGGCYVEMKCGSVKSHTESTPKTSLM